MQKTIARPESETNIYVNAGGLLLFFVALWAMNQLAPSWLNEDVGLIGEVAMTGNALVTAICMLFIVLPPLAYDIFIRKIYTHPETGLGAKRTVNWKRVGVKLFTLYATFAAIIFAYWLFPEYGEWYARAFQGMLLALPFLAVAAPFYFAWADARQLKPEEDSYYRLGRLVLFAEKDDRTRFILAEHTRNWMVKGFFLPLMFTFLADNVNFLSNFDYRLFSGEVLGYITNAELAGKWYKHFFDLTQGLLYTVDVAMAAAGYAMAYRGLNSHIRSVEPTTLGWVICVVCYPPFWNGLFFQQYFNYDDDISWGRWLWDSPVAYMLWGSLSLALLTVYSWATVAMGYRFSNLTYRGLITSGPYRITKHPAYVAKNLFFWMVSVPFLTTEAWYIAIQHCLLLFGVNLIYYTRARTEERHLLNYPEYREYCQWMDEHGWFRSLKRFSCFDWRTSEKVGVRPWWGR